MKQTQSQSPRGQYVQLVFFMVLTAMALYTGFAAVSAAKNIYWDFPNYYTSSRLLAEGESVERFYDNAWFASRGHDFGFERVARFTPFPPATATLLLPFSGLTPIAAKRIWVLINVLLLLYAIRLVHQLFKFDWPLSTFLLLLLGSSLALNFRLGQFYLVILVFLLLVYKTYLQHKWVISGVLLSIITLIKYFPVIFIFGFLKKKFLMYFGIAIILLLATQWLYFGTDTLTAYGLILQEHLNGNIEGQGQHVISFQSFDSLLANIFIQDAVANPTPIVNWPIGKSIGKLILLALAALSAVWTLWKLRSADEAIRRDLHLVIVGMSAFTVLPASAAYHFILLFFPFILLLKTIYHKLNSRQRGILICLFGAVANSTYLTLPFETGIASMDLLLAYPRLWSMSLLYIYTLRLIHKIDFGPYDEGSQGLTYQQFTKMTRLA